MKSNFPSIIQQPLVNRLDYVASEKPSKARKPKHTIVLASVDWDAIRQSKLPNRKKVKK